MIGTTLQFVTRQINQFICNRLQTESSSRKIILASHVSPDGTFAGHEENVLLFILAGIRKDSVARRPTPIPEPAAPGSGKRNPPVFSKRSPPVYLNLQVLIAANFRTEQIQSGLDLLAMAIAFLQGNPLWNAQKFPGMPPGVADLVFEMETLDYQDQSHLWGAIGAKYMPSVNYKVRMLTIDDQTIDRRVPGIQTVESHV